MQAIKFDEQNMVFGKDQKEYLPLPAHHHNDENGTITFCMKLSKEEIEEVVRTGVIWHNVLTFNKPLQPQHMRVDKPLMVKE